MTNLKHVNSIVDREFRNRINQLIDLVNAQGKSIQDLVAEGQLTEEQYANLITSINGLVKSGQVDKSDLTPEFKGEIEGFNAQLAHTATKKYVDTLTSSLASGSPKGVYKDVAGLQNAFPTGNSNIYLVGDDWYYWDSSNWVAGGKYQSSVSNFTNMLENSNVPTSITISGPNAGLQIRPNGTLNSYSLYSASSQVLNINEGHIYYTRFVNSTDSTGKLQNRFRLTYSDNSYIDVGAIDEPEDGVSSAVFKATKSGNAVIIVRTGQGGEVHRVNQMFLDLTEVFGKGNEPSLDEFESVLNYFPASWVGTNTSTDEVQRVLMSAFVKKKNVKDESDNLIPPTYLPDGSLRTIFRDTEKFFLHYDTKRKILYATEKSSEGSNGYNIFASYDRGLTWTKKYTAESVVRRMYTTSTGYHIINHSSIGRLVRVSPDFSSTTTAAINKVAYCLNTAYSIAEHDGVILYAEYGATPGALYRILKSTDDGLSWSVVHDGVGIRHWHGVQVDPYTGHFWAFSGDSNSESSIIYSTDKGNTWNTAFSGSQMARACGLVFFQNEIIWAMDVAGGTPYVMKMDKTTLATTQVGEVPNGNTTLGVYKTVEGIVMGWTRIEQNSTYRESCCLWATDGTSIKVLSHFAIEPEHVTSSSGSTYGFTWGSRIDDENVWFTQASGTVLDGMLGFSLPVGVFD